MEAVLRPLGMSITHYSCLELLARVRASPAPNGLVSRPEQPSTGRVLPTELTAAGRRQLLTASAAVKNVEDRMKAGLSAPERAQLADMLSRCVACLNE